jgi:hypothetical protein
MLLTFSTCNSGAGMVAWEYALLYPPFWVTPSLVQIQVESRSFRVNILYLFTCMPIYDPFLFSISPRLKDALFTEGWE